MTTPLRKPPASDEKVGFVWFNWFKKLFQETLGYFKTDGSRDITGSVTATGTGLRFYADFSSTPHTNRLTFVTSTANLGTSLGVAPNGSSDNSAYNAWGNSTIADTVYGQLRAQTGVDVRIVSGVIGTGTYVPLNFWTNGAKQLEINTSGRATFTNDAYVGTNVIYHAGNLPSTGGKLKSQLLTTADSSPWTWPSGVDEVWITMVGGGAGGRGSEGASIGGGGGGSGEYVIRYPFPRLAASTTTFTVGVKGNADSDGAASTFGTLTVQGGKTSATTVSYGGKGGGDLQVAPTTRVAGVRSIDEGVLTFSGANGGAAGTATVNGNIGGGCEMYAGGAFGTTNGSRGGGGGGGSSIFGAGGGGGNAVTAGNAPGSTAYGAGGGGAGGTVGAGASAGAAGQNGCILLEWIG